MTPPLPLDAAVSLPPSRLAMGRTAVQRAARTADRGTRLSPIQRVTAQRAGRNLEANIDK